MDWYFIQIKDGNINMLTIEIGLVNTESFNLCREKGTTMITPLWKHSSEVGNILFFSRLTFFTT